MTKNQMQHKQKITAPVVPPTIEIPYSVARGVVLATGVLAGNLLERNVDVINLHEIIDPKTQAIHSPAMEVVDPYSYFVHLYTAIRLGCVVNSNGGFTVPIAVMKWFADNAEAIQDAGGYYRRSFIESFFEGKAVVR